MDSLDQLRYETYTSAPRDLGDALTVPAGHQNLTDQGIRIARRSIHEGEDHSTVCPFRVPNGEGRWIEIVAL